MDKIDIILWIVSGGFTITFGLMVFMWNGLNHRIDKLEEKLNNGIEKLDKLLTDVDRRLCHLEGTFSSKDCCQIGDEKQFKKAE